MQNPGSQEAEVTLEAALPSSKAAAARLTFDDDPAAFASVMAKEAK